MVTPDGMFMSWHRIHNSLLIIAVHKHTADRTGSVSVSQIYFTQTQNKDNKSLDISGKSSSRHSHNLAFVSKEMRRPQETAKILQSDHG